MGARRWSSQEIYVLLPSLLLQAILTPGLISGACHDCLPTTAWAKTGLSGGHILTATKLSSDNFPITDVGRPYPTRTDVPFQLNGLTIAALGVAGVFFVGFMVCTARIIVIALCCPRSSDEPGSGRDVPAAAALTPEAACGGASRGRGGHISLTIVHPNNEVAIGTRLAREGDFKPVGVQLHVLEGSRSASGSSGTSSDSSGTTPFVHEDMPISAALGEHPTLNGRDCRPTACRGAGNSPHPCCG